MDFRQVEAKVPVAVTTNAANGTQSIPYLTGQKDSNLIGEIDHLI